MKNNLVIKLHSDISFTKGRNRSILIDFNRKKIDYVPNSMADILLEIVEKNVTIDQLKEGHSDKDKLVIQEYLDHLIKNEYAFFTETPELFSPLDESIEASGVLTNAIIDIGEFVPRRFELSIRQLSDMNCPHLEIRIFSTLSYQNIMQIVETTIDTNFRSVQLIIQDSPAISYSFIENLFEKSNRLLKITVSNSDKNETKDMGGRTFQYTSHQIIDENHCGYVHLAYFNLDKSNYLIGKNYNSCLYGKLSIDQHGHIKNCPAMKASFGKVESTLIEDVISDSDFKTMWNIKKDNIDECKNCELRYICSDCRAFTKNNEVYSRPTHCSYEI